MKKALSILLMLVFVMSVIALGTVSVSAAETVTIRSGADLMNVLRNVNDGRDDYSGKTVVLEVDLDLFSSDDNPGIADNRYLYDEYGEQYFSAPIGCDKDHPFRGTFNGNNHTVVFAMDTVSYSPACEVYGLFGYNEGTIKNLVIGSGLYFYGNNYNSYTGGVAAVNCGTIDNCVNYGIVPGCKSAGGICAVNSGTVTNCLNYGQVAAYGTSENVGAGGIVGRQESGGCVYNCANYGQIVSESSGGGIVGYANSGTVMGAFNAGGVVNNGAGNIKDLCAIVGKVNGSVTINKNYYLKGTNLPTDSRATGCVAEDLQSGKVVSWLNQAAASYGGSFSVNKWYIGANNNPAFSGREAPVFLSDTVYYTLSDGVITVDGKGGIPENAFKNRTDIKEAVLGEGIDQVYLTAFSGCTNLRKVTVKAKEITFNRTCFNGCTSLHTIDCGGAKVTDGGAFNSTLGEAVYTIEYTGSSKEIVGKTPQNVSGTIKTILIHRFDKTKSVVTPPKDGEDGFTTYYCRDCAYTFKGTDAQLAGGYVTVGTSEADYPTLDAALSAAISGGRITLLADCTLTSSVTIDKSLTIDLCGHTISSSNDGERQFTVKGEGVQLTMTSGKGYGVGTVTGNKGGACGFEVGSNAALVLDRVVVTDFVKDNYVGSAVAIWGGKVIMKAESVIQNSEANVGCVYMTGGSFTMESGAVIKGCTSVNDGGSVYMTGGSFTMESGALITKCSSNYIYGVGIYVCGGTLMMKEGSSITECECKKGGGIYMNGGTAYLSGSVKNCKASHSGGGVYLQNGSLILSGDACIYDNYRGNERDDLYFYFQAQNKVTTEGLTQNAKIGVRFDNVPPFAIGPSDGDYSSHFILEGSSGACAIGYENGAMWFMTHNFGKDGKCIYCKKTYSVNDYKDGYADYDKTVVFYGAKSVTVRFSYMKTFNNVNVYDRQNNLVKQFSGAGDVNYSVVVPGDTVRITYLNASIGTFTIASITPSYTCYNDEHRYDSSKDTVIPATCTENGKIVHYCLDCEYSYEEIIPAKGHNYPQEQQEVTPPTCTEEGKIVRHCANCDYSYTETVDAKGHSIKDEVVAPTCTEQGYTIHRCENCDYSVTDSYVDPTGHTPGEDGVCTVCGETVFVPETETEGGDDDGDTGEGEGTNTASVLSDGNIWIVIGVVAFVIGGVAVLAVVKKKKRPATANGANVDDEE